MSRYILDAGTKDSLKRKASANHVRKGTKKLMKRCATVKYKEQEQAFNSLVEAAWAIGDPISADQVNVDMLATALNTVEGAETVTVETRESWQRFYK